MTRGAEQRVKVSVRAEREDYTPEHAEKTFGFASGFAESVRQLQREHSRLWGWCRVAVTLSYKGHSATAYLGSCCYRSRQDFISSSGYYEDLVQEATEELAAADFWDDRDRVAIRQGAS